MLGSHPELRGTFVRLRALEPRDAAVTLAWRMSDRASLLNRGAATVEQQAAWIRSRPAGEYNFIIERIDGAVPVGMLSLTGIDEVNRRAEPGRFLIGDAEAVRGIPAAVEAMRLLYDFAFDRLGLVRVHGTVAADNVLMTKWQKFLGMREEGRLRQHYFIGDRFQDAIVFGLLVDEYRSVTLPRMKVLIAAGRRDAAADGNGVHG